jgi:hypothetical protein
MGKLQELLATLLPDAWAASMESESRAWRMRCPCGVETSIWDMGGIRWKAAGQPRRIGTCGACGREFLGAVYRNDPVVRNEPQPMPRRDQIAETISDPDDSVTRSSSPDRGACLLWIDGVGCWMLHVNDRMSIGGPGISGRGDPSADLKLLADLSRSHASLARCGESYVLAADGPATVSGNPASRPTVIRDGDLIGLGDSVRLRFRQPNALSLTVRLEFDSQHRPARRIDGVLLMDQACILGPADDCHVVCHDWERRIIVFRRDGKLWCKRGAPAGQTFGGDDAEELYVNGCRAADAAPLRDGSIVTLGDSRFRIEMPAAEFV